MMKFNIPETKKVRVIIDTDARFILEDLYAKLKLETEK